MVPTGLQQSQLQALRKPPNGNFQARFRTVPTFSLMARCYHYVTSLGPWEGRGWGNSMLLMLGVVSSVMMLYDADMLLLRKIRVVLARRRRFLPVCFGQS